MRIAAIILLACLFSQTGSAQKKKDKDFKDGYIIRLNDTVRCKIYSGFQENEIGHEVTFKYADGRIITYHAGSVLKGFGFKDDKTEKHFYEIDVPEYILNEQKNNKAYAEVLSIGHLRFLKYTEIKNSIVVVPIAITPGIIVIPSKKSKISCFIKIGDTDSLYKIGHNNAIGPPYFTREEIVPFLRGNTQLMAEIKDEHLSIKDLKAFIDRHNLWYTKRKQIAQ